jgi:hypothetical protein
MGQPLQRIHRDYYRFVELLIAQAELKQLTQWRIDVKQRSKIPLGMSRVPDWSRADSQREQHFSRGVSIDRHRGPRARHLKRDENRAAVY